MGNELAKAKRHEVVQAVEGEPRIQDFMRKIAGLLVPGETVITWGIQRRIFALVHRRTIVVATSGRLMCFHRNLIVGHKLLDVRWQDLRQVSTSEGIFGADISVSFSSSPDLASASRADGGVVLAGLRKDQARSVYRVCQQHEQSWREKRRVRDLEEMRAKSGGLQLGGGNQSDAAERLRKAKEMKDGGLLSDAEFESVKAKIMAEI